jgi:Domain of unknown function (DUF4276)
VGPLVSIVEGDGEVIALPVLLRRLIEHISPGSYREVARPIRVRRDRFLNKEEELRRMLSLAAAKAGDDGGILILLDADDDCPAILGQSLAARVHALVPQTPSAVVLANREFEAWFIAACQSLHGVRGFDASQAEAEADLCETVRDAKGWMRHRMPRSHYSPISDQAAFSQQMDLPAARQRSRSFRKLLSAVTSLCSGRGH